QLVAGRARRLAMLADDHVRELVLDPQPAWTELAVPLEPKAHVLRISYRDDELTVATTAGAVFGRQGAALVRRALEPALAWNATVVRDLQVAIGDDGKLHYASGLSVGTVALPAALPSPRVVGRAGLSRFVVVGQGAAFVYDADDFIPRRLAAPSREVA